MRNLTKAQKSAATKARNAYDKTIAAVYADAHAENDARRTALAIVPTPDTKADKTAERAAFQAAIATERDANREAVQSLCAAISIPIKSVAAYAKTYKRAVAPHVNGRKPSARQAAAIAVAALSSGVKLSDGAAIPRNFTLATTGAKTTIENGCLADMQRSGLATYNSATETLTIATGATAEISGLIGTV